MRRGIARVIAWGLLLGGTTAGCGRAPAAPAGDGAITVDARASAPSAPRSVFAATIRGTEAQLARLRTVPVEVQDHGVRPLKDGRWQVQVLFVDPTLFDRIRALGLEIASRQEVVPSPEDVPGAAVKATPPGKGPAVGDPILPTLRGATINRGGATALLRAARRRAIRRILVVDVETRKIVGDLGPEDRRAATRSIATALHHPRRFAMAEPAWNIALVLQTGPRRYHVGRLLAYSVLTIEFPDVLTRPDPPGGQLGRTEMHIDMVNYEGVSDAMKRLLGEPDTSREFIHFPGGLSLDDQWAPPAPGDGGRPDAGPRDR